MKIKEVSEKLELTSDTLRYYEKIGLLGPIKKNKSGIREYDENDINRLTFIKCMRSAEIPIEVLKKYLDLYDEGEETFEERRLLLEQQKNILEEKIKNMNEAHEKLVTKLKLQYQSKLDNLLDKKQNK